MLKSFFLQLQFLTRIPLPVKIKFDGKAFARGVVLAPVVGLIIGLVIAGVYNLALLTGRPLVAVLAALIAEIFITGGLHLDGLADTADGIFSNRPKAEILRIMKDPHTGTNGTLALILLVISKIGLLLMIDKNGIIPCLIVMPVLSRMNIAWAAGISVYARKEKSAAASIVNNTGTKEIIIATAVAIIPCVVLLKLASAAAVFALIIFAVLFTLYVKKRIGGITGDIIGAVIELSEIVFLFVIIIYQSAGRVI